MSSARTNTLVIRTPEGIAFSMLLAGPVSRFLAWGMDVACILVMAIVAGAVVSLFGLISADFAQAFVVLVYFVIQVGYGIVMEWAWRGQTVGKKFLRLRVVDMQGLRLQFSQIVIRNLLRFVDGLPVFYLVGGVACLVNRRAQRLGDIAASTVVIRVPRISEPNLDLLLAGKFNSLREYPHLTARLHQRVSPAEAKIALQALLRRDELDAAARVELFGEIAAHFRLHVEFPPDAVEGITDEQFVRNVVDILFRPTRRTVHEGALE